MRKAWTILPSPGGAAPPLSARMPAFVGLHRPAPTMKKRKLLVIGAGSVGQRIALHGVRAGYGTIGLVDDGAYKAQSLATHDVGPAEVGVAKVEHVGQLCKAVNPEACVLIFHGTVQALPIEAMADFDVVCMATDNLAAEAEVGRRCVHLGLPLLHASVHGPTLVAQVRVFTNAPGGACPMCLFGQDEWAALAAQVRYSCQGGDGAAAIRQKQPTMSTSALCSMAADLASIALLRHSLSLGAPLQDSLIEYAGYTNRMSVTPVAANAQCPCDHQRWERRRPPRALARCTIGELLELAAMQNDGAVTIDAGGAAYVRRGRCGCGREHVVERFAAAGDELGACAACGGAILAQPFHTHSPVSVAHLLGGVARPLYDLGVSPGWVLLEGALRSVWFWEPATENV